MSTEILGAANVLSAIVAPYRVVVSVPGDPTADDFGTLFAPPAGTPPAIARVVVRGGQRSQAAYDRTQTLFQNPTHVEVWMRGEAAPRAYDGASFVSVAGGKNALTAKHRGFLRHVMSLGTDAAEAVGEMLGEIAIGAETTSYAGDLAKLSNEVHALNAEVDRAGIGDSAWYEFYREYLHDFYPEASRENFSIKTNDYFRNKIAEYRTRLALHRERLAKTVKPSGPTAARPPEQIKPATVASNFLTRKVPGINAPVWAVGLGGLTVAAVIAAVVAAARKG